MAKYEGCYIAYPIDNAVRSASSQYMYDQIENVKGWLIGEDLASWCFDPGDAFRVGKRPDDRLARINRHALNEAELVVAFLPRDVTTVGVPMEIDRAVSQGKVVVVMSDTNSWMLEYGNRRRYLNLPGWDPEHLLAMADWLRIESPEPMPQDFRRDPMPVVLSGEGRMPTRAYATDAGLDLYVSEQTVVPPGGFRDVPAGISVELPDHQWGLVTGRSSALRERGLLAHTGVIDPGYRGPLFAGAFNLTDQPVTLEVGERVAQFIIMHNATRLVDPIEVRELSPSPRGTNGFGSSGA